MKKKSNAKRGFTLAEAVIAMAIIMIISISVISLQITMIEGETKAARDAEIIQYAEDVLDCFNWAANGGSEDEMTVAFQNAMEKLGFTIVTEPDSEGILLESEIRTDCCFVVCVNFEIQPNQLEIKALTTKGEEIYRFTYEK